MLQYALQENSAGVVIDNILILKVLNWGTLSLTVIRKFKVKGLGNLVVGATVLSSGGGVLPITPLD